MRRARVLVDAPDWREGSSAVGFLLILVVLVPLAHASPPDPLWLAGIYDGGDFDDAVMAVVSASGVIGTPVPPVRPVNFLAGTVRCSSILLGRSTLASPLRIRAPPSPRSATA